MSSFSPSFCSPPSVLWLQFRGDGDPCDDSPIDDAEIHAYNKEGDLKPITAVDLYFTIRGGQEIERVFVDTAE